MDLSHTDTILEAQGLNKAFKTKGQSIQALDGVTLRVKMGIVTGLIGPDGAGKTTFMRLIAGLLLPDSGTLEVLHINVVHEPLKVQASVGYMPQRFGLYEDLTVQENLDLTRISRACHSGIVLNGIRS